MYEKIGQQLFQGFDGAPGIMGPKGERGIPGIPGVDGMTGFPGIKVPQHFLFFLFLTSELLKVKFFFFRVPKVNQVPLVIVELPV